MIELLVFGDPEFDGYATFSTEVPTLQAAVDYLKDYPDAEFEVRTPSTRQLIAHLWSDECTDAEARDAKSVWESVNGREW